ncbi:MAG: FtsQ-type POTRA domain-containing protein [Candidatus Aminicenantes bacterium]|nr:FtsQ-type POTRA domain-containing protein [Candidatus Aminicenantes bacterium]
MSIGLRLPDSPSAAAVQYRRGRRVPLKKRRRTTLRLWHVVLFVLLQAAVFTGLQRLCLFLFEWDHLRLSRVEVHPRTDPAAAGVEAEAARLLSTNLLLLDTERLATRIKLLPRVKSASIRKAFPGTLRVDITFRRPLAVLDRGALFLVDEEGVLLGTADAAAPASLPVLRDAGLFQEDYPVKIGLARICLERLPSLRARVEEIDLTDPDCLALRLRGDPARLLLGGEAFEAKVALYLKQAGSWEEAYGSLETVDLRLPGRAVLRLRDGIIGTAAPAVRGEVM